MHSLPPPQIPRLRRFETASLTSGYVPAPEKWLRDRMAACWSWISPPVAKCVYGVCAFVLRCLSCSHTVLPKELSLGVIFFSPHFPHVMLYFFFPCLPTCISLLIVPSMIVYVTNNKEP